MFLIGDDVGFATFYTLTKDLSMEPKDIFIWIFFIPVCVTGTRQNYVTFSLFVCK